MICLEHLLHMFCPLSFTLCHRSSSAQLSSLQNKSPTRRPKSRWEPLVEGKPFVKPASTFSSAVKFGVWNHQNENNKKSSESFQKVDAATGFKPTYSGQNSAKKKFPAACQATAFFWWCSYCH